MYRQHMFERRRLHAGDIHQQAVGGQVAEVVDDLAGDIDGHRHHHQTGSGEDLVSTRPVGLFQRLDPIA